MGRESSLAAGCSYTYQTLQVQPKTTIAELLTPNIDASVVPHEIIQSLLLESDMSVKDAGNVACEMDWAMTEKAMHQGLGVIIDTPCFFQEIISRSRELAHKDDFT